MVELGIIEGYYGRPWSWEDREETIEFLAGYGYRFYLYAPKADAFLRKRWREPYPAELERGLARVADRCERAGVRFGIGLTPYDAHLRFDAAAQAALSAKLELGDRLGADDLGILFDDMRGDLPDLAERQAEIVDWVRSRTSARRIIVCPSYYTDDPVLDRVFGRRPEGYLENLGALLASGVEVFWTGEEVCSREISPGHVERVAAQLGRRPFLWDNYPVNDGQRMSQYLHLRGFTGRPASLAGRISGHAVNPALQPTLTRIPAMTLAASYGSGDGYAYGAAFREAAETVLGADLGSMVWEDLLTLQDVGLDRLEERAESLRERYQSIDHPGAREILDWLDGGYRITAEIVRTQ